jgi:hypothetical protein
LAPGALPTIGANGTIFRRSELLKGLALSGTKGQALLGVSGIGDYLFDIDVVAQLANRKPVKFAKVKTGIIHLYCGRDLGKFIRKQRRRIKDYFYYQKIGVRSYPWQQQKGIGLFKFVLSCVVIIPLIYQSIKGYFKKPDKAWLFHPLARWITFAVYGSGRINSFLKLEQMNREKWGQ